MNSAGTLAIVLMITGVLAVMGSRGHSDDLHEAKPAAGMMMKEKVLLGLGAVTLTLGGTLILLLRLNRMRREARLRYY